MPKVMQEACQFAFAPVFWGFSRIKGLFQREKSAKSGLIPDEWKILTWVSRLSVLSVRVLAAVLDEGGFGAVSGLVYLVMLNLFQHPWPELSSGAALKKTADHGS